MSTSHKCDTRQRLVLLSLCVTGVCSEVYLVMIALREVYSFVFMFSQLPQSALQLCCRSFWSYKRRFLMPLFQLCCSQKITWLTLAFRLCKLNFATLVFGHFLHRLPIYSDSFLFRHYTLAYAKSSQRSVQKTTVKNLDNSPTSLFCWCRDQDDTVSYRQDIVKQPSVIVISVRHQESLEYK